MLCNTCNLVMHNKALTKKKTNLKPLTILVDNSQFFNFLKTVQNQRLSLKNDFQGLPTCFYAFLNRF